jgi:hypothetical protein
MALTLEQARERAQRDLESSANASLELVLGGDPLESEHYWVFFYNTPEYWETRDVFTGVVGNGPIVVPKDGSPIRYFSSALSTESQLQELEAANA